MRPFWIVLTTLLLYTGVQAQTLLPDVPALVLWGMTLALFGLMVGWLFIYRSHAAALEARWFFWLAWCGAGAFGLWATFVMLSLPVNIVGLVVRLIEGNWPQAIRPWLIGALGLAVFIALLGLRQALLGPVLKTVDVSCAGLTADLYGLTIAQISDLHVGPTIRRGYVEKVVRQVMDIAPDLIAITGDLADGHADRLEYDIAPLARLRAPLGVYFITGNHEYYWDARQWIEKAAALGFKPLINSNIVVPRGACKLLIGGITDPSGSHFIPEHRSDPAQAAISGESVDFKLLLAHRPDACDAAAAAGFDLQLSGHTHGGQFFPFNLLVRMRYRYHSGLFRHGSMWLYVSPGTGYWGPPHRFGIPPEITLLRLVKANKV